MILPSLVIGPTGEKGRGVFATEMIPHNTIIEASPVIVMSADERKLLDQTLLHDYIFVWGEQEDQCCVGLGYISIYNHAYDANCEYDMDFDHETISIKTVKTILQGEELTINYNGSSRDTKKVWFDVK